MFSDPHLPLFPPVLRRSSKGSGSLGSMMGQGREAKSGRVNGDRRVKKWPPGRDVSFSGKMEACRPRMTIRRLAGGGCVWNGLAVLGCRYNNRDDAQWQEGAGVGSLIILQVPAAVLQLDAALSLLSTKMARDVKQAGVPMTCPW